MKTIQNPKHYKISKMSFFRFLAILAFSGVGARADQAGAAFGFAASLPMFAPLVLASCWQPRNPLLEPGCPSVANLSVASKVPEAASDISLATAKLTLQLDETNLQRRYTGLRLSGILPGIFKAEHPAQLINPWAPAKYGSGEGYLVREFAGSRAKGLALFSIRF